jgi:hypothetical protein
MSDGVDTQAGSQPRRPRTSGGIVPTRLPVSYPSLLACAGKDAPRGDLRLQWPAELVGEHELAVAWSAARKPVAAKKSYVARAERYIANAAPAPWRDEPIGAEIVSY